MDSDTSVKLLTAIRECNTQQVKELLEQGLDPDTQFYLSGQKQSAISIATESKSVEIVDLLCQYGCSLSPLEALEDPLHIACQTGDFEIVKSLLNYKANVKSKNISGKSPLHLATKCSKPSKDVVKLLLQQHAEVDSLDLEGRTPLMYASHCAQVEVCEVLLHHGADPMLADFNGMTPLHFLTISTSNSGQSLELLSLLLKSIPSNRVQSCLNKRELVSGGTPLHCLIQQKRQTSNQNMTNMLKMIIANGADLNAQNGEGRTPLHLAINTRQFDAARLLVSSGCLMSSRDLLGRDPLIEAARLKEIGTLNLLLKADRPSYSQELLKFLGEVEDESTRENLLEKVKNPGSLQDLSRRSLVRATGCRQTLKESLVPTPIKKFLQFQDCLESGSSLN